MLEQVHQHILGELDSSAWTDTIFIITAVVFNLIVLGVNSFVVSEGKKGGARDLVLGIFIALILLVNSISTVALYTGKSTRTKLLQGLLSMYRDNDVDKYYDPSLLTNYGKRYSLLIGVIICLAATAIVVPLVMRIFRKSDPDKSSEEYTAEKGSDK